MVRPINSSSTPHPPHRQVGSPASPQVTPEAGKAPRHAIGQQAKAAVMSAVQGEELPKNIQAKAAVMSAVQGEELPRNIQGKVASALARGLSLDTIINLQEPSEPSGDTAPITDVTVEPVVDEVVVDEIVIDDSAIDVSIDTSAQAEPAGDAVLEVEPAELPPTDALLSDSELTDLMPDSDDAEMN